GTLSLSTAASETTVVAPGFNYFDQDSGLVKGVISQKYVVFSPSLSPQAAAAVLANATAMGGLAVSGATPNAFVFADTRADVGLGFNSIQIASTSATAPPSLQPSSISSAPFNPTVATVFSLSS